MSEFFLELFSEEVPANLQKNTREALLQNFTDFFEKENISFSEKGISLSTLISNHNSICSSVLKW